MKKYQKKELERTLLWWLTVYKYIKMTEKGKEIKVRR